MGRSQVSSAPGQRETLGLPEGGVGQVPLRGSRTSSLQQMGPKENGKKTNRRQRSAGGRHIAQAQVSMWSPAERQKSRAPRQAFCNLPREQNLLEVRGSPVVLRRLHGYRPELRLQLKHGFLLVWGSAWPCVSPGPEPCPPVLLTTRHPQGTVRSRNVNLIRRAVFWLRQDTRPTRPSGPEQKAPKLLWPTEMPTANLCWGANTSSVTDTGEHLRSFN